MFLQFPLAPGSTDVSLALVWKDKVGKTHCNDKQHLVFRVRQQKMISFSYHMKTQGGGASAMSSILKLDIRGKLEVENLESVCHSHFRCLYWHWH
jgi:hypothetical protein